MSRIHEALKRAEEERAAQQTTVAAVAPVGEQPPVLVLPAVDELELAAAPSAAAVEEAGAGALTLSLLTARCARPAWKPDPRQVLFLDPQVHTAPGAEEFRTLRSRLYRIREKQPLKTLLVGSAVPGEGKSFVSSNLAQMMARQRGRRILLIDGDLRRSSLHHFLGALASPGLLDYLRGNADEFAIVQQSPMEGLFFISAGTAAENPAEFLNNGRLKMLIQRLEPVFDWIIMDSPPVVPVSDASLMSEVCDGVVLVVKAASTPCEVAQKARDEFKGRPLLGVVLNGVESSSKYGSYYYYHGGYAESTKHREGKRAKH
jgi:capsular exopolysaccharide synthesis family protein